MNSSKKSEFAERQNKSMVFNISEHKELNMMNMRKDTPFSVDNSERYDENADSSKHSYHFHQNQGGDSSFIKSLDMQKSQKQDIGSSMHIDDKISINTINLDKKQNTDKDMLGGLKFLDNPNTQKSNVSMSFLRSRSNNTNLFKIKNLGIINGDTKNNAHNDSSMHLGATPLNEDIFKNKNLNGGDDNTRYMVKKNETTKKFQTQIRMVTFILPKMRKFLETKTFSGKVRYLDSNIRMYINDLSDDLQFLMKRKLNFSFFFNILIEFILLILRCLRIDKIPLINPENPIKLIINTIIVAYNCFYLFIMSVEVFFEAHFGSYYNIFNSIATFCWISEMLIQMNTSCYHDNKFVTDRKVIMKIYLKEYFFFEIIPILFEGNKSPNNLVNILLHLPLLLKIKGMMIILQKLEFYILQVLQRPYILTLFKLCMQVVIFGHIIACSWYSLGLIEEHFMEDDECWIQNINQQHLGDANATLPWQTYYLEALYWSFSQIVHNSQEKPVTLLELAYSSTIMLLSSLLFVYLLNSIGEILNEIDKQNEEYKKDLNILNQFMKRKKIDLSLRRRANLSLLNYYQQQSKDKVGQEKEIINKLPEQMQSELLVQSNQKLAKMFPIFYDLFSEDTMVKLYSIMEEEVYAPNQIIFNCDAETLNDNIYLIIKGSVVLYIERGAQGIVRGQENDDAQKLLSNNYIKSEVNINMKKNVQNKKDLVTLKDGETFGLHSFITGTDKIANIMSKKYTHVIKIQRSLFLNIIKENKEDFEKFMELKDKVYLDKNTKIGKKIICYVCKSQEHTFSECNKVQFDKLNPYIIFRHLRNTDQERSKGHHRNPLRSTNSVSLQRNLAYHILQYQEMNDFGSSNCEDYTEQTQSSYYEQQMSQQDMYSKKYEVNNQSIEEKQNSDDETSINYKMGLSHKNNGNNTNSEYVMESANSLKLQKSLKRRESKTNPAGANTPLETFSVAPNQIYGDQLQNQVIETFFGSNAIKEDEEIDYDNHIINSPPRAKKAFSKRDDKKKQTKKTTFQSPAPIQNDRAPLSPQLYHSDDNLNRNQFGMGRESHSDRNIPHSSKLISTNQNIRRGSNNNNGRQKSDSQHNIQSAYGKMDIKKSESKHYHSSLDPTSQLYAQKNDKQGASLLHLHEAGKKDGPQTYMRQGNTMMFNQMIYQQRVESGQYLEMDKDSYIWKIDQQQDFTHYFQYYNLQNVLKRWYQYYLKINRKTKKVKQKSTYTQYAKQTMVSFR
ncbi:histone acetyltransferase family protein (macronuclear) [Tetrahymena thermophila SB210]|uniref:Histone acetyltransferase family protein n=1 Tax=Tetrahymena thermophila (strain SB210) TaxID=312017 RepID=Q245W8_TETTS|nr:histone acetyltransferase family protein [Tetrahymena thermophila SB210]EAS03515.3 histone acetyltransferase family protein [Tetrahymena thermophila SB210]|eukprot:XP_001023760.3 histone acetyltransferase family protein [Tetrahymena thermophila SB210]